MYEQYGRKLKRGCKALVLAKPYRHIGYDQGLPLRPSQELIGQVVEIVGDVKYYQFDLTPDIMVKDAKGFVEHLEVGYLRVVSGV